MATKNHQHQFLSLQPFYGGSHQQFIEGWCQHSRHSWKQMTLPARHWKWRMRHSAIYFAEQINRCWSAGERWAAVLCTDMTNLAELRGLLNAEASRQPFVLYFHENQYEYPNQHASERDLHFGFTNFVSAAAADQVWFNSEFNRQSFLRHLDAWLERWPDFPPRATVAAIEKTSVIQSPGIAPELCVSAGSLPSERSASNLIHLIWAARWEHDKNPEQLLQILEQLSETDVEFRISVVGQQFRQTPAAFQTIKEKFGQRIEHWGFLANREEYWQALRSADVFLSTATHEFFGIAAIEAIACGCFPLLPKRLSYPGVLSLQSHPERECFFYCTNDEAIATIQAYSSGHINLAPLSQLRAEIHKKFDWNRRATEMDNAMEQSCDSGL